MQLPINNASDTLDLPSTPGQYERYTDPLHFIALVLRSLPGRIFDQLCRTLTPVLVQRHGQCRHHIHGRKGSMHLHEHCGTSQPADQLPNQQNTTSPKMQASEGGVSTSQPDCDTPSPDLPCDSPIASKPFRSFVRSRRCTPPASEPTTMSTPPAGNVYSCNGTAVSAVSITTIGARLGSSMCLRYLAPQTAELLAHVSAWSQAGRWISSALHAWLRGGTSQTISIRTSPPA
jgi:hypothetical protein